MKYLPLKPIQINLKTLVLVKNGWNKYPLWNVPFSNCFPLKLQRRRSVLKRGDRRGGGLIFHSAIRIPQLKLSKMPLTQATFVVSSVSVIDLSQSRHQSVVVLVPIFPGDSRARETRARVKITPREKSEKGLLVVYSCSGGPASLCFLGSSWVVWGQKMCVLKSLMSQVLSNTSVKVVLGTKTGGRGATVPLPPLLRRLYVLERREIVFKLFFLSISREFSKGFSPV